MFYHEQVALRRQKKEQNEEYCFAPLLVTLENMRRLTVHILQGHHFHEPLTRKERAAFVQLNIYTRRLIALEAPYTRSVQLAVLMMTVLEIVTARQVVTDLARTTPALWDKRRITVFGFSHDPSGGQDRRLCTGTSVDLTRVLACRWGGLNPRSAFETAEVLFEDKHYVGQPLSRWLEDDRLFLYPSFEPLDPEDFGRFGHLPVYPLGMMTRYALNADGFMMTPLAFMVHDAIHCSFAGVVRELGSEAMLEGIDNRLLFRTLALDSGPGAADEPGMRRALALIFFVLFHEWKPSLARAALDLPCFLPLLHAITSIRREHAFDYPVSYKEITDLQALLACRWVHWLYHQLCDHPDTLPSMGPHLAEHFRRAIEPLLQQHWSFFSTNKERISAWFLAGARRGVGDRGLPTWGYASGNPYTEHVRVDGVFVFRKAYSRLAEGPVDHTDLAWFEVLAHRPEYQRMVRDLGMTPPPCLDSGP